MLPSFLITMGQALLVLAGLVMIAMLLALTFDSLIFLGSRTKATSPTGSTKATRPTTSEISSIPVLYIPAGARYLMCDHQHAHRYLPSCPLCAPNVLTGFGHKDSPGER